MADRDRGRHRLRRWVAAVVVAGLAWAWWGRPGGVGLPLRARFGGPRDPSWCMAFAPDGSALVTGRPGRDIAFRDPATGRARRTLTLRKGRPDVVTFSADGRWIACQRFGPEQGVFTVTAVEASSGTERAVFEVPRTLRSLRFSPDGSSLDLTFLDDPPGPGAAPAAGNVVRSWDTATWREGAPPRPVPVRLRTHGVAVAPDGRTVAECQPGWLGITLFDADTGATRAELVNPASATARIESLTFSTDSATLAVGKNDGTIELWDAAAGRLRSTLRGHSEGYVPQLLVFAGPRTLASMGRDFGRPNSLAWRLSLAVARLLGQDPRPNAEVAVWDLDAGRPRALLRSRGRPTFSRDGKILATTNAQGEVEIWDPAAAGARP